MFLKKKRRRKNVEFYMEKNSFDEEEDLIESSLDKSGISSASEINDELIFGKNYLTGNC